jgi:hypothetical protein
MLAGLGRPQGDGEDKYALFDACSHNFLFEGDTNIFRGKLHDAIVIGL